MVKTFNKTLELDDYEALRQYPPMFDDAEALCLYYHLFVDPCHTHRRWEMGMAMEALNSRKVRWSHIVDLGAGLSLFGPAVSMTSQGTVEEWEPATQYNEKRGSYESWPFGLTRVCGGFDELISSGKQFDAVFCLSVVEHFSPELEERCWERFPDLVAPGGLIFLTTDVFDGFTPTPSQDGWHPYPSPDAFWRRMARWPEYGLTPLGSVDLAYHGSHVNNYTFMSAAWAKR